MKNFATTMACASIFFGGFILGYCSHDYRQNAEVQEVQELKSQPERRVDYEVYEVDGDTYRAYSNSLDKNGMREGIEFTKGQVVYKLAVGDKVSAFWDGKRLKNVIAWTANGKEL
ncbi:hypothetical protein PQE66_gp033 [Bacillus phage PBC2]|uniref:Uncharacterized protein n=1 Tax=Bacillus phage PBC2 TaxID=1675029 RepID=A0A218KBT8_9CAUD|nr:hypothetical protein PQE66_gp033 [Bacillus phage PBC2]AKQ08348.1 hypothetical protein PBC2_033 [Bacillus phage PBC2]